MVGSKQGHKRYRKRKKKKEKKAVIANNKAQWLHVNVIVFFFYLYRGNTISETILLQLTYILKVVLMSYNLQSYANAVTTEK